MESVIIASLITALFAGLAALCAPCCIGVLLPTYLASIFRQRKTVLLMTFVFFLGLLTVFLPLGLGVGFLGELFKEYHNTIYLFGSIFLFLLGISILLGFHWSLPFQTRSQVKVAGAPSVFVLGIFSGFATLCCAPVLAGALALSLLPGSILWGGLYSVFYVLGMVLPLFIIAYSLDKTNVLERTAFLKKELTYTLLKKQIAITVSNLFSGIVFIIMSIILLYSVLTNKLTVHSSTQTSINIMAAKVTDFLVSTSSITFLVVALILLVAGILLWKRRAG